MQISLFILFFYKKQKLGYIQKGREEQPKGRGMRKPPSKKTNS